jgi:hypothetical protein
MGQGGVGLIVTEANTTITADVGLIGSGIASALMAARLAEVGIDVAILEAGPKVDRFDALLRYRDAPDKGIGSPYLQSPDYPYPGADARQPWYIQSGPDHFKSGYLKAVGGTTWHWLGTTLRFLPDDFRMITADLDGRLVGWAIVLESAAGLDFFLGGIDYERNLKHLVYRRLLVEIVRRGIESGASRIDLGQTAEIPKMRLGGTCLPRHMGFAHGNPILSFLLDRASGFLEYSRRVPEPHVFGGQP